MANDTKTIKKSSSRARVRRQTLRHHRAVRRVHRTTRPLNLIIPTSILGPLPMEQRLRAAAIERTRGILKGKGTLKEHLDWLRKLRNEDGARRKEQEKLWRRYRNTL